MCVFCCLVLLGPHRAYVSCYRAFSNANTINKFSTIQESLLFPLFIILVVYSVNDFRKQANINL